MADDQTQDQADTTMGDVPIEVTRRVAIGASRGLLDDMRMARRRQELQAAEMSRPTGTELAQTRDRADKAIGQIGDMKAIADKAANDAAGAVQQADAAVSDVASLDKRVTVLEQGMNQPRSRVGDVLDSGLVTGWGVDIRWTQVAAVAIPAAQTGEDGTVLADVSVTGRAKAVTGMPLKARLRAGSDVLVETIAVPVGEALLYPGQMTGVRIISISTHCKTVRGAVLAVDVMTDVAGSYPDIKTNGVRLTAHVDYTGGLA